MMSEHLEDAAQGNGVKSEFSEFSYGYALTDNLRRSGLGEATAAPVLPSLADEGAAAGGYDLAVPIDGIPLLLQFKVPEVLTKRSKLIPAGWATPYYRMYLRPSRHSEQHALLMEHDYAGRAVFYAAPRFHTTDALNDHFLTTQVYHRSFLIKPSEIGALPDPFEHCVAYQADGEEHEFQSERRRLFGKFDSSHLEDDLRQRIPDRVSRAETRERLERLKQSIIDMVEEGRTGKVGGPSARRLRDLEPIRGAAYAAQLFLDCELFIVGRR